MTWVAIDYTISLLFFSYPPTKEELPFKLKHTHEWSLLFFPSEILKETILLVNKNTILKWNSMTGMSNYLKLITIL